MKIFLDDERETPKGWTRTFKVEETIEFLKTGNVIELSLDHDLGGIVETGYDVLLWIEQQVFESNFIPPKIHIHTSNASAMFKMLAAVKSINRLRDRVEKL